MNKHKLNEPIDDQIMDIANGLIADAREAYIDGDEVGLFKALERMKLGAEGLATILEVVDNITEGRG